MFLNFTVLYFDVTFDMVKRQSLGKGYKLFHQDCVYKGEQYVNLVWIGVEDFVYPMV